MMFKLLSPFRLALAAIRVAYAKARGFRILATDAEQDDRLYVCSDCDELTNNGDCRVCGCDVTAKTMLATEQCPRKYWLRIWSKTRTIR